MKNKFTIGSIVIAGLCGALHVSAQPTPASDTTATPPHDVNTPAYGSGNASTTTGNADTTTSGKAGSAWRNANDAATANNGANDWQSSHYRLGKLERAEKIIGREIKDSQDQKIGKVKDLAVDLQNGRLVEVIVGTGGVLGVEEKFMAVPPSQFTCDAATKTLTLNMDKAKFMEAPSFKLSEWPNNVRQGDISTVYQYYGTKPYFTSEEVTDQNKNALNRLGEVERADKLIGTTVHNMQNDRLGKVHDLIVDLHGGRVVEVILASGGFLGMGDEFSAVPPQSFHGGTESDTLVLDTTKDALSNAPHFKSSEWPEYNNEQVTTVYHAYNVQPNFSTDADNTAQNVRDRSGNTLTPVNQGTSDADMETTREIRKQIMADESLSVNAHNVKVITLNGKVTLRGTVNNPDEKRKIADIAAKVATPGNVDDQLQVENRTSSTQ